MKQFKKPVLATLAMALAALVGAAGTASATIVESEAGNPLPSGTSFTGESEGTTILHPPIGSIECENSHVAGKSTNAGGSGVNVNGNIEALSFSSCNATVTVLKNGTLSVAHASGSNGFVFSTGTEITVVFAGFHCIFKTNNTSIGTFTGGTPGTLDIEASIPRTGGSSGIFCGTTAALTGSYVGTGTLNVTG